MWRVPVIQRWGGSGRRIMGSRAVCTIQVQTAGSIWQNPTSKKLEGRKETLEGKMRAKGSRNEEATPGPGTDRHMGDRAPRYHTIS